MEWNLVITMVHFQWISLQSKLSCFSFRSTFLSFVLESLLFFFLIKYFISTLFQVPFFPLTNKMKDLFPFDGKTSVTAFLLSSPYPHLSITLLSKPLLIIYQNTFTFPYSPIVVHRTSHDDLNLFASSMLHMKIYSFKEFIVQMLWRVSTNVSSIGSSWSVAYWLEK